MQKVFDYIRKHGMIEEEDKVIVGVSGGADSLCLLFVLKEYQIQTPFSMLVVHIEHGVRGEESRKDAEFVKNTCEAWGISCRIESFDVPALAKERKISVEEAGRNIRYETFEQLGKEWGATKIAVAHNQNDQAETMLWNMVRGSGLNGAGGIRPVRGKIIRPLLCAGREEIEAYLGKKGISWCSDSTNEETEYTRNCIRHHILPAMEKELNAKTVEHLARLAVELQRTEKYLNQVTEKWTETFVECRDGQIRIPIAAFQKEESLIQERIIRLCLERAGCGLKDLGRIHVEQILSLFEGQSGRKICLPGEWKAIRTFDVICLKTCAEELSDMTNEKRIQMSGQVQISQGVLETEIFAFHNENIPQKKYTKWLNYDKIKGNLCLRTRQPGDYLIIDQKGSKKKLKDYFIQEKIPADMRDSVLLVASGSEILWVIGYRINEAYKVLEGTQKVLCLTWETSEERR